MRGVFSLASFFTAVLLLLPPSALAADTGGSTSVSLSPRIYNTLPCESINGRIDIAAASPGTFSIRMSGIPQEWVEYPESVYVSGKKTVNFIVNPKKGGNYRLRIDVSGSGKTFSFDRKLWVGGNDKGAEVAQEPAANETGLAGGMAGMVSAGAYALPVLVSAGVVLLLSASLILIYRHFKRKRDMWR
jgi:hypothetical protein